MPREQQRLIIEIDSNTHRLFRLYCFEKGITMKQKLTGLIIRVIGDHEEEQSNNSSTTTK